MKTEATTLRGKHLIYYYEYPTGNRTHGGGGWSRQAKRKPAPVLTIREVLNPKLQGKSVLFDNLRKLKCTIVRKSDGTVLREDYPLQRITQELLKLNSPPSTKSTPSTPSTPSTQSTKSTQSILPPFGKSPRKIHP
jgi:hypothetical protein